VVYKATVTILAYGYEAAFQPTSPDDPVYPYPRLDPARVGPPAPRTYRAVVLENRFAALSLIDIGGGAEVGLAVSSLTSGKLTLWAGEQMMASWPVTLYPGPAFRADWVRPADVSGALGLLLRDGGGATIEQMGTVP
jgi:hypothetical protein